MKEPPEWTYHETRKERRARVLSRLSLTRAVFKADHNTGDDTINGPLHHPALSTAPTLPSKRSRSSILLASPNAQMISIMLVCSVIFGPRRLFALVGLPIVRAWSARTIRGILSAVPNK